MWIRNGNVDPNHKPSSRTITASSSWFLRCGLLHPGRASMSILRDRPPLLRIDTFRERYDVWLLKKYGLPWLYWNVLLRGRRMPFLNRAPSVKEER